MEVTLLIEAMENSFRILDKAGKEAVELLDSAVKLTAETRDVEKRKIKALFQGAKSSKTSIQNFAASFILLFGFWALLSGMYDPFHLIIGALCAVIIAWKGYQLLFANTRVGDVKLTAVRLLLYIPWLLWQIIMANIHVIGLALSPNMRVDPKIIRFKSKLESDISYVTLANSITLTPGTITMDIKDGEFFIHAIDGKVAEELNTGAMEDRVAHIFMEADHIYVQDVIDVAPIYSELRRVM